MTDGIDTSNADLDAGLISDTNNQVISIGISGDIDDAQLQAIGRDGSFLAENPAQWASAFAAVAERVDLYPQRSYLLGYCSSASEGNPDVEISVVGPSITQVTSALCSFNAELFSSQGGFTCDASFFANECNGSGGCGGLTGCGACPDTQCCDGSNCLDPTAAEPPVSCVDQIHVCEAENLACAGTGCATPAGDGGDCSTAPCAWGTDFCAPNPAYDPGDPTLGPPSFCIDAFPLGSPCEYPEQCASLNCYYPNPENPFEGRRCLPEARIGDHCGDEDAICESGAFCLGSTCEPQRRELVSCNAGAQCRQGVCANFDVGGNFCAGPNLCYWDWEDKVPN